ncbi:MAG: gliding motility-associated C-terminal domain-containing protein [Flavobacteriales bacterium]|nr:gliding motility-associated C-terminal domain-containing protein [Flavobacteriales bacterium]
MKNTLLFITATLSLLALTAQGQITVTFSDGGSETIPCNIPNTFLDGYNGAYPDNENQTFTVCVTPGEGLTVSFSFSGEEGGYFDIDPSDTLFVYDGPDVNSPLLATLNNTTAPFSAATGNTTLSNSSGCITFQFVTDGANGGQGFQGVINCNYSCQPIEPWFTSEPPIVPNDSSGSINICLGDTVWLYADAGFPMSPSNGGNGYNQTLDNSTIEWFIFGEPTQTGDSIMFIPTQRAGYFVDMLITDSLGCFDNARTRIQVSTIPSFASTGFVDGDTICLGELATAVGGVTPTDTAGVDPTTGNFLNGGLFGEALELPDGSGTIEDIYTTTINISGFEPGDTIASGADILSLCVSMEHSFLGDLEMWLTCPGGQDSIVIFNAYNGNSSAPGFVPGGFSPGGINLGIPGSGSNQGTCFEYCFSITENNLGTFASEFGGMSGQMDAGTYLPEETFENLIGCPINGDWNLSVADSWPADDGWICEWGITFDPDIDPNSETYEPVVVDAWWTIDPTIIVNQGDTIINVEPNVPGDHLYTFNITDDFGCSYDTSINLHTVPPLSNFLDTAVCSDQFLLSAADYEILGEWSYTPPLGGSISFNPNEFAHNPTVTASQYGDYEFVFQSDYCSQSDTVIVDFNPVPSPVPLQDQTVCPGTDLTFDAENTGIAAVYNWQPTGETTQQITLENITQTTGIQVTVNNECGTANGAATITVESLDVSGPSDVCLEDVADLSAVFTTSGGTWTYTTPAGADVSFSPSETDDSPSVSATAEGAYTFWFTDDDCGMIDSVDIFFTPAPTIDVTIDTNRICVEDLAVLTFTTNTELYSSFSWEPFGSTEDTLMILGTDSLGFSVVDTSFHVIAMVSNFCGEDSEEIVYKVIDCTLDLPNVFNPESSVLENTYFNVVALDLHPGNNMKIFDRWGRKVYDVDNYHLAPWNGGKNSDGVYYYVLTRPGYEAETGFVHLVHGSGQ